MKDLSKLLEVEFAKIKQTQGNEIQLHLKKALFFEKLPLQKHPLIKEANNLINVSLQKINKLPRAGFALRWTKAHLKLISHVKRLEELEKRQKELESEISSLKKKWFRG